MGEFRNDREAAHQRAEALEQENRELREALAAQPASAREAAKAPGWSKRKAVALGVLVSALTILGAMAFLMVSRSHPGEGSSGEWGMRWRGSFVSERSGVDVTLRAGVETDGTWLVGDRGTILFRSQPDGAWQRIASGVTEGLRGIASGGALCAVGDRGVAVVFDSSTRSWVREATGTTEDLRAVVATDVGLIAVGARGTALFRGNFQPRGAASWIALGPVGDGADLHAVARTPAGEVIAVGDRGTILAGPARGPWTRQVSPTTVSLRSVAVRGGELLAVGDGGVAVHTQGLAPWSLVTTGTTRDLYSVALGYLTYEERGPNFTRGGLQQAFVIAGEGGFLAADQLGSSRGWYRLREGGPTFRAVLATEQEWRFMGDRGELLVLTRN